MWFRLIHVRACVCVRSKSMVCAPLVPDWGTKEYKRKATVPYCVSLAWSADGSTLYAGYTDGDIRVWTVNY